MNSIRLAARWAGAAFLALLVPATTAAPLELHSFSPPAASLGHEVILRGRGLSNVTAVTFNGVGAPFRPLHDGALRARVPAGRVDGPVTVWAGRTESASVPGFRRTAEPLSVVVWNVTQPDLPAPALLQPPADLTNAVDAAVTPLFGVAVRDNGDLVLWGRPPAGAATIPPEARDLVQVSANSSGWLALRADGRLIAQPDWGSRRPPATNGFVSAMLSASSGAGYVGLSAAGLVTDWLGGDAGRLHGLAGAIQVVPGYALRGDGWVVTAASQNPTQPGHVIQMAAMPGSSSGLALGRWGEVVRLGQNPPTRAGPYEFLSRGLTTTPAALLADGTPRYELASPPRTAPAWLTGVRTMQGFGADFVALAALPPRFTRAPESLVLSRGGTARLEVEVAGTGPFRLRWFKDGVPIPGATAPVFEIPDAEIFDEGAYACLAGGPHGVALSAPAQLRIIAPPAVTALRELADGTLVLEGARLGEVTAVTFNGVGAFPLRATAGRLELRRPAGNLAGPVKVWVGNTSFAVPDNVQATPAPLALARWLHRDAEEGEASGEFTDPPASPLLEDLVQVAAVESGAWALRRDGRVVAWGNLQPPRLLGGDVGAVKIAPVVSGLVVALRPDGSLVTASSFPPILFQPGPSPTGPFISVQASSEGVAALRPDGRLAVWGPLAGSNPPPNLQPARDLAVFGPQIAVLEQGGTVARWGGQVQPTRVSPPPGTRLVQLAHHGGWLLSLDEAGEVWRHASPGWQRLPGMGIGVTRLDSGNPWAVALRADGRAVRVGWGERQRVAPAWLGPVRQASATDHALLLLRAGPPVLAGEPEDLWLAPGATAELAARPEPGQLDLRYTWLRDGQPQPGETNAVLLVGTAPAEQFRFDVVARTAAGATTQHVARVRGAAGAPHVTALQPEAGPAGSVVTVEGGFLASVTAVTFNGHAAWFRQRDDGHLETRVPNRHATGGVEVWSHDRRFPTGRRFTLTPSPGVALSWGYDHAAPLPPPALTNVQLVGAGTNWSLAALADGATHLWGHLPPGVSLPLTNVVAAAGIRPTLLLEAEGVVRVRGLLPGETLPGIANLTETLDVAAMGRHRAALRRDGSLRLATTLSGQTLASPAGWTNLVALAAGGEQLVALRADGRVLVWGGNLWGQRDVPPALGRAVAVAAGGPNLAALTRDGRLLQWGRETLAAGPLEPPAFGLALGADFAVLALTDGRPAVLNNRSDAVLRPPEGFTGVGAVAAGAGHIVALGGFPPAVFLAPPQVRVPLGAPGGVELRAEATGSGPLHYRWLRGGQPFSGPDAPVLRLPAEPAGTAWYTVEVSNAFGRRISPGTEVRILGPLRLRDLRREAGGTFHAWLEREGTPGWEPLPGHRLVVETSTDLVNWTPALYGLGADGRLAVVPDVAGPVAQFFRVREVPAP